MTAPAEVVLAAFAGREREGYLEIRHPGVGRPMFFEVGEVAAAADHALSMGSWTDAYAGTAPRVRRAPPHEGGKAEDVHRAWTLSADCDDDLSLTRLEGFDPPPTSSSHRVA